MINSVFHFFQQHVKMIRLTKYDLHTIQSLSEKKRWRGIEICRQIKNKHWVIRSVNNAIKRLENTASIYRKEGNGQSITVVFQINVETPALSQENCPGTHESVLNIDEKIWLIQNGLLVHKQHKKSGYKSVKMLITPQTAGGAIQRR